MCNCSEQFLRENFRFVIFGKVIHPLLAVVPQLKYGCCSVSNFMQLL